MCVSFTARPSRTDLIRYLTKDDEQLAALIRAIPMRRLGESGEIAPLVNIFCSEQAALITDTVLSLDGGRVVP